MPARQNILIVVAILLAGLYVYFFTDWINAPRIRIISQTRPIRPKSASAQVYPVAFLLDGAYKLTSIRVVHLSAFETNKFAPPLWHLVAQTNVPSTQGFLYGARIPGMRSKLTNVAPQRLQPDTVYRLFVEAGLAKGQIDFRTSGAIDSAK